MGQSSSSHRNSPVPQGNQQVFVYRNGAYTQSPIPQGIRYDMRQSLTLRPPNPPDLKKTKVIKNPVNLKKETLSIKRHEDEVNILFLTFEFDSDHECEMEIFYLGEEPDGMEIKSSPSVVQDFSGGLGQKFFASREQALDLMDHPIEKLTYKPQDTPETYPIIIKLQYKGDHRDEVKSQYTYASLIAVNNKWDIQVIKQKVRYGSNVYEIKEIYGVSAKGKEDDDAMGRECVICMSDPRDTAVLPCRHLCLCQHCANIMRLQCNKCPICRQPVSSLLQIEMDESDSTNTGTETT